MTLGGVSIRDNTKAIQPVLIFRKTYHHHVVRDFLRKADGFTTLKKFVKVVAAIWSGTDWSRRTRKGVDSWRAEKRHNR